MKADNRGGMLVNIIGVIAACTIIATIFFIVTESTREHINSRESHCQSNIKECAIALHAYMNDYDNCLPSSYLVRHSKKWNRRDFIAFATKRGEIPPSANNRKTWSQIMYNHMRYKDILFCPTDKTSRNDPDGKISYCWKLAIDKAWYGEGCSKAFRKYDDYIHNPDQVIFYERNSWHRDSNDGLKNGVQINVAFLDTHVKSIRLKNATSGNPINCAANPDGEPMHFNYDNKKNAPLPAYVPAKFVDPGRYSDAF